MAIAALRLSGPTQSSSGVCRAYTCAAQLGDQLLLLLRHEDSSSFGINSTSVFDGTADDSGAIYIYDLSEELSWPHLRRRSRCFRTQMGCHIGIECSLTKKLSEFYATPLPAVRSGAMPQENAPASLLSPQIDIVFKLLFTRNQHLLLEMLSAILDQEIDGLEVLNPTLLGQEPSEKFVILDIRVRLSDGKRVDVEMQIKATTELASRLVYYTAKDFAQQLKKGEVYREVTPTVTVVWLVEPLFPRISRLHSIFELRERQSGWLFTDDIQIHLLQLSALKEDEPENVSAAERKVRNWARFLTATSNERLKDLAEESPIMAQAAEALEDLSQDPAAQRLAEQRADSDIFYDISIAKAEDRGEARGRAEGEVLGKCEALRERIEHLCSKLNIELSEQRRKMFTPDEKALEQILDSIALEHRWPE